MNFFNELIKKCIQDSKPLSFGKVGAVEEFHLVKYLLEGKVYFNRELGINAGVFPLNESTVQKWLDEFQNAIQDLDCILSWESNAGMKDYLIRRLCKHALISYSFSDFEPFEFGEKGWHYSLGDKRILVVSPLASSIENQFSNYSNIWPGAKLGGLTIIPSPHSPYISGESKFNNYFDALQAMKSSILMQGNNFEFAVVGAGAYSLPLLQFIKGLEKPCIHLGGATQLLFGIRGSRWDNNPKFKQSSWYNNQYWISPLAKDTPRSANLVEGGCYW